jgi:hypothetical protein
MARVVTPVYAGKKGRLVTPGAGLFPLNGQISINSLDLAAGVIPLTITNSTSVDSLRIVDSGTSANPDSHALKITSTGNKPGINLQVAPGAIGFIVTGATTDELLKVDATTGTGCAGHFLANPTSSGLLVNGTCATDLVAIDASTGTGRGLVITGNSTSDALTVSGPLRIITGPLLLSSAGVTISSKGSSTTSLATAVASGINLTTSITGRILLTSSNTAAGATSTITVTHASVAGATTTIFLRNNNYTGTLGTNGVPVVHVNGATAGSWTLRLHNAHATNALNGTVTISYFVIN